MPSRQTHEKCDGGNTEKDRVQEKKGKVRKEDGMKRRATTAGRFDHVWGGPDPGHGRMNVRRSEDVLFFRLCSSTLSICGFITIFSSTKVPSAHIRVFIVVLHSHFQLSWNPPISRRVPPLGSWSCSRFLPGFPCHC